MTNSVGHIQPTPPYATLAPPVQLLRKHMEGSSSNLEAELQRPHFKQWVEDMVTLCPKSCTKGWYDFG